MCVCFVYFVDLSRWMPRSKVAMDDEDDGPIDDAYIAAALAAPNTNKPLKASAVVPEYTFGNAELSRGSETIEAAPSAPTSIDAWLSQKNPSNDGVILFSSKVS